jgi:hypothetical protein
MAKTSRTTTVTLSDDDLKNAVVAWAKRNGVSLADDTAKVEINIRTRTTGYGMSERDEHYGEVVLTVDGF